AFPTRRSPDLNHRCSISCLSDAAGRTNTAGRWCGDHDAAVASYFTADVYSRKQRKSDGTVRADYRICTSDRSDLVRLHRRILAVADAVYHYCAARCYIYSICLFLYAQCYRTDQSESRYIIDYYVDTRLWRNVIRIFSRRRIRLDES